MTIEKTCPNCGKALAADALMGLCPACLLKAGMATGSGTAGEATSSKFVPPTPQELARFFPQLDILELIGRGGMGAVYRTRQRRLERLAALKILPPSVGHDPAFADRFEREAKALAKLHHQNIVTLYEFGQADGLFYFLMEFVDGVNLRQLMNAGHLTPKEALAIVPQICEALQFAHDRSVVHRDIKPENILLTKDGQVKIADFGVAKIVGERGDVAVAGTTAPAPELTEAGRVIGTPQYMAPEQREHPSDVDHRADIYSLGVVFYQMLTGELPGRPIEPPSRKVQIDIRLDEIVLHALEREPERRYQQVSHVKTMIETIGATPHAGGAVRAGAPTGDPGTGASARSERVASVSPAAGQRRVFWQPVVGLRHGQRVIHWPGVILDFCIWCGVFMVVILAVAMALAPIFGKSDLIITLLSGLVVEGVLLVWKVRRWLRLPMECLKDLDALPQRGAFKSPADGSRPAPPLWWFPLLAVAAIVVFVAIVGAVLFLRIGAPHRSRLIQERQVMAPPAYTFGLTVERTMAAGETLDLDTGWQTSVSNAYADLSAVESTLYALDMAVVRLDHLAWWGPAAEIAERFRSSTQGTTIRRGWQAVGASPDTYAFCTREGGSGVLQVLSIKEFPGRVEIRIRYKLVHSRNAAATVPQTDIPSASAGGPPPALTDSIAAATAPLSGAPAAGPSANASSADREPRLQFRWVADERETSRWQWLSDPQDKTGRQWMRVRKEAVLDERTVVSASITNSPTGDVRIALHFSDAGAKRLAEITAANIGRKLAIVFDGQILAAPSIMEPITGGMAEISGTFSRTEAAAICDALNRSAGVSATALEESEAPKLRFLAWQDENVDDESKGWNVWHFDGTRVEAKDELKWIGHTRPARVDVSLMTRQTENPRFLFLWFSHPAMERTSFAKVTLYDDAGRILAKAAGAMGQRVVKASEWTGEPGWILHTVSPGCYTNMPPTINVRLEYGIGPWTILGDGIAPGFSGPKSLGKKAILAPIGQSSEGHACVSVTRSDAAAPDTQYGFLALTKDGREVEHTGGYTSGFTNLLTETSEFPVRLDEVRVFQIRTRPVRSIEFKNVPLLPSAKALEAHADPPSKERVP